MMIKASSQLPYLRENISELTSTCQPLWHPLGFVSCVIRSEKNSFITRIHYWPKFERRTKNPDWPIHTHVYDLSSQILDGRVRDIQYRLKDGADYAIYSVCYSGENSALNFTNEHTSIEKVIDAVHEAGEEYTVAIGSFHQTRVPFDESAVSLVVLSNFVNFTPLVLGTLREKFFPYSRVKFDKLTFWNRIGDIIRSF